MTLGFSTQMFGKPNYFVEKILSGIYSKEILTEAEVDSYYAQYARKFEEFGRDYTYYNPKIHSIRGGDRWKEHHKIHYVIGNRTKNRFQFAPLLPVKKIQEIEIRWVKSLSGSMGIDPEIKIDGRKIIYNEVLILAKNDGFDTLRDFLRYFNKDFKGQLIQWTDKVYA